jgi:predicted PurR-regulated permease PerM
MPEINRGRQMIDEKTFLNNAVEATVRIGILALIAAWCFSIVKPFIIPIAWGVIIAVGAYPGYVGIRKRLGNRRVPAAMMITVLGLIVLILPTVMLSGTVIDSAQDLAGGLREGSIAVPPPSEGVKEWPMVGEELYEYWTQANANLGSLLSRFAPQLQAVGTWLLSTAAGAGFAVLQFVIAIVISGILLANSDSGGRVTKAVARRLAGEKGVEFAKLAEATVRSVARGILGVSLIQSLLIAVGFVVMDIPGAGLWALLCLILSVIQIGPMPIVVPILIYVFSTASTASAVLFLIWSLFTGAIDSILKPIMLGRGVEVPMAVIFVGAIGGFISSGIIGLFVGAVVLVLGYKLFMAWLAHTPETETPQSPS